MLHNQGSNTMSEPNYEVVLRQRDKLAYLLQDLIDRISDHGQEQAIRLAREYMRDIGVNQKDGETP